MNPALRSRLLTAAAGGTLAIAAAIGGYYEGDGPTETVNGVKYHLSYVDVAGVWTVCKGLTGPVAGKGKRYTAAQCKVMEEDRLRVFEAIVREQITDYDTFNKWRQASLIDFTYNVGAGNLAGSTLRQKFNAGDHEGGCRELVKWSKARVRGVLTWLRGLFLRRSDEMELCLEWK
jgi:lysozyme